MKILLATNNKHKIKEITQIFQGTCHTIVTPGELGLVVDVNEDGKTFAENSLKKAQAFCNASGLAAIADDSGLVVKSLGGAPGVHSARYGGEGLNDAGRTQLLLKNMAACFDRRAAFECAISMVFPDGRVITSHGSCEGNIAIQASTNNGFGYDPVFVPTGYNKTFAELSSDIKNSISHRGKALALLQKKLEEEGI